MTILNFEAQELSVLIRALETLKSVHPCPVCDFTLQPILDKLANPPLIEPTTKAGARAWTAGEDAIIRKYSAMGSPVWTSIQTALPDRTVNMIKARYGRLGLGSKPVPVTPEPKPPQSAPEDRVTPGTEHKPPTEPAPEAKTATVESTEGWSPRPPSLADLMKGR